MGASLRLDRLRLSDFKLGNYLLIMMIFGLLVWPIFLDPVRHDGPRAAGGQISFQDWKSFDRPVPLRGEWRFAWLNGPGAADRQTMLLDVPGHWAGRASQAGTIMPSPAAVRFNMTLTGLRPGIYRLTLPQFHSANRILIDGRIVAANGQFGLTSDEVRYHARAYDIAFASTGRDVELSIEIAKLRDLSSGFANPPLLGSNRAIQTSIGLNWAREFIFDATLLVVGLFGLVVFVTRRSDRAALYLGLGAIAYLVPMVVSGFDNIWSMALPDTPYDAIQAAVWIGTYAALALWLAYGRALFPRECPRLAYLAIHAMLAATTATKLILLASGQTMTASYVERFSLMPVFVVEFAFLFYVAISAARNGRTGAALFVIGQAAIFLTTMLIMAVGYGYFRYGGLLKFDLSAFGMLLFSLTHIMILAERWSAAITAAETLNADMSQLLDVNSAVTSEARLETLLTRIVGVTSRILNAERSSLFLHDGRAGELWSLVAEGMETREIRIPEHAGIAGHVFQTSQSARVDDAYADSRFAADVDANTGFLTRNLVAVPIVARDGRKLGVLQALNSLGGTGFSQSDETRLAAFAAQAAIAIDNATLFSEVVASRNYNESILQSMSSGVVTLQGDGHQARLNHAAARILKISRDQAKDADARAFLEATNPDLIPEIDAVAKSGEPKSLIDRDIVTATGETVSANISIVPLHDEERTTGVLVMLDDISASKRLEGAMRRFMTQEVMDQVLGQRGDALFGAACDASVLFADIRNFTTLAEKLSPRETVDMLNEIFTDLFEAVADADGVLDKYIGDAIMAVFGAPLSSGRDAANAVEAALRMQKMMAGINTRRALRDASELRLGIGIASGEVIAGTIGSPKRMDYTVIGDRVNLASRLQDATKQYGCGIIVCDRTARQVEGKVDLRELDRIRVKGRATAETIFEVTGRA